MTVGNNNAAPLYLRYFPRAKRERSIQVSGEAALGFRAASIVPHIAAYSQPSHAAAACAISAGDGGNCDSLMVFMPTWAYNRLALYKTDVPAPLRAVRDVSEPGLEARYALSYHFPDSRTIPHGHIGTDQIGGAVMATSRLQRKVSKLLYEAFDGYGIRENSRPPWNLSDDGTRLELDFYIEELAVAIEVQGSQHLVYSEYFHGDHDGFTRQKARDEAKAISCNFYNVRLFEIFHDDDIPGVLEKIREIRDGRVVAQRKSTANWTSLIKKFNTEARALIARFGKMAALNKSELEDVRVKQKLVNGWITKYGTSIFDNLDEFLIEETIRNTRKLTSIYEQAYNRYRRHKKAQRSMATQRRHVARKQRRAAAENDGSGPVLS